MDNESFQQTSSLIRSNFDLMREAEPVSEEELLALVADRIELMLERETEQLMSMLYRLDVEERKILPVMHPAAPEPPHIGLARLVIERQKQRIETKRSIKTQPLEGMDDWAW